MGRISAEGAQRESGRAVGCRSLDGREWRRSVHRFSDWSKVDPELVEAARLEELRYFITKHVWKKVPRGEALAAQGKPPITVKWIDTNKGDDDNPNYRSRLVAREVIKAWESSIFSPTPPLEALRSIIALAATDLEGRREHVRDGGAEDRTQISIIDIRRAYFNARTNDDDPTYVELPNEDADKFRGLCGKLLVHMYGTRKAAKGWHTEFSEHMAESMGFVEGLTSACVRRHSNDGPSSNILVIIVLVYK